MRRSASAHGFSMVELSVVLVIIGLLVGGLMVGQSMIRAAELRSVIGDYRRFATAAEVFRQKYSGLPGDITNATSYFGKDNTNCAGNSGTAAADGVCNGDGSGIVGVYAGATPSFPGEMHQVWRHLAAAGMIEGKYYSGLSGAAGAADVVPGTNSPTSKIASAGWGAAGYGCSGYPCLGAAASQTDSGNYFVFGAYTSNFLPTGAVLTPADALSLDAKIDDGKPAAGTVLGYPWTTNTCTTASSATDTTAAYYLSNTAKSCALWFVNAY